jgi:phosphatidylserine/phosphatidylglycerophosphate/cardiolipin synthase-like enzyme
MRYKLTENNITVTAIAGTYVVVLSIEMEQADTAGLLGFAIQREDLKRDEKYYLQAFKRFAFADPVEQTGALFSSFEQPIQSFLWEDFTASPGVDYKYAIIPVTGKPKNLVYGQPCTIAVTTEDEDDQTKKHAVYFNRGVAGSLAYARKFGNKKPGDLSADQQSLALAWLSRGLKEAMLGFIARAADNTFSIRADVYEFKHKEVLDAFSALVSKGISVKIVYDHRGQGVKNDHAIAAIGFPPDVLIKRQHGSKTAPAHNKFIILYQKDANNADQPIAVWTGSTNITAKGIYGQCNTGHIINDPAVAALYSRYWDEVSLDPDNSFKDETPKISADLDPDTIPAGTSVLFSPRNDEKMLQTYATLIKNARQLVCGIFPFSFSDDMKEAITAHSAALKLILSDKEDKELESDLLQPDPSVQLISGTYFKAPLFDWLTETHSGNLFPAEGGSTVGTNFVHNKVVLIDPLSDDPIVVGGSANFSPASISSNDENSIIIRGNTRVADIYFTEFSRIFNHYYVRIRTTQPSAGHQGAGVNPLILKEDNSWTLNYYKPGDFMFLRQQMFNQVKPTV